MYALYVPLLYYNYYKGEKATIVFEKNLDHYNGRSGDEAVSFKKIITAGYGHPRVNAVGIF